MRDVAAVSPRRDQWRDLIENNQVGIVTRFIADSLDENDRDHNAIWRELQGIKKLLIGILVSTTTASILLAINIVTGSL